MDIFVSRTNDFQPLTIVANNFVVVLQMCEIRMSDFKSDFK